MGHMKKDQKQQLASDPKVVTFIDDIKNAKRHRNIQLMEAIMASDLSLEFKCDVIRELIKSIN